MPSNQIECRSWRASLLSCAGASPGCWHPKDSHKRKTREAQSESQTRLGGENGCAILTGFTGQGCNDLRICVIVGPEPAMPLPTPGRALAYSGLSWAPKNAHARGEQRGTNWKEAPNQAASAFNIVKARSLSSGSEACC